MEILNGMLFALSVSSARSLKTTAGIGIKKFRKEKE